MKLTNKQLKQLIKEEVQNILSEQVKDPILYKLSNTMQENQSARNAALEWKTIANNVVGPLGYQTQRWVSRPYVIKEDGVYKAILAVNLKPSRK